MGRACLKVTFYTVNIVYTAVAVGLAVGAIWCSLKVKDMAALRNHQVYTMEANYNWAQILPYAFVAIGAYVFLVNLCGCCGAGANSKGGLIVYNIFALIAILAAVAAAVISEIKANKETDPFVKQTIVNVFEQAVEAAHHKGPVGETFAEFEKNMHCCGADGPNDYKYSGRLLPETCCIQGTDCTKFVNRRRGCVEVATYYSHVAFLIVTVANSIVAFLILISMILSWFLMKSLNSKALD